MRRRGEGVLAFHAASDARAVIKIPDPYTVDMSDISDMIRRMEIKVNDIVKYAQIVDPGDENARFIVREIMPQFENGPQDDAPARVRVELICDMRIRPTKTVLLSDLAKADA